MKKLLAFVLMAILCVSMLAFTSCDATPVFTAEEMLPLCNKSAEISYFPGTHYEHHTIEIKTDVYTVAFHNIDGNVVTIDYVHHSRVDVTAHCSPGLGNCKLTIKEDLKGTVMTSHSLYMVIGIPKSWSSFDIVADIDIGSLIIEDSQVRNLQANIKTGVAYIDVQNATKVSVRVNTGDAKLVGKTESALIRTDTGSIDANVGAKTLRFSTDTGAIDFEVINGKNIYVESDTGSIRGKIHGDKAQYSILVDVELGSCNVKDQIGTSDKVLEINADTGSANIEFVQ